jgi:hypothetical protein
MIVGSPVRVVAVTAAILIGGAAAYAAAPAITADGVGDVELGRKASKLKEAGLIGRLRDGCELAPNTRTAKLKAPLQGEGQFHADQATPRQRHHRPRWGQSLRGGGWIVQARDQGGLSAREVRPRHGGRVRDHPRQDPKVRRRQFQFAVDVGTKKVTLIGVPFIAFCE